MKEKIPLHKKYGSTFFIFPLLLPLAELLPWILLLIGALAAFLQFSGSSLLKTWHNRRMVFIFSACCIGAAALLAIIRFLYTPLDSESVPVSAFSTLQLGHTYTPSEMAHNKGSFSLLWKVDSPNQNSGKPAIAGNLLMIGTLKGTLDAFSIVDGQRIWVLQKHQRIFSTPFVSGNLAFVGEGYHASSASVLTAFSFPDGKPLWERKFRGPIESSPVIDTAHNRLWVSAGEIGLWSLGINEGEKIWWSKIGHSDVPPLYENSRLFAAAKLTEDEDGSALFELNPDTGAVLHSTKLPGNPVCAILPAREGAMVTATATGKAGAMDTGWAHGFAADGTVRWTTKLSAPPLPDGVMLLDKSRIFYTLINGSIVALNTADGSLAWQVQAASSFATDATLMEDGKLPLLAAISPEGIVTVRNTLNGQEIANFSIEKGDSYPLYYDGTLYIATPTTVSAYTGFVRRGE